MSDKDHVISVTKHAMLERFLSTPFAMREDKLRAVLASIASHPGENFSVNTSAMDMNAGKGSSLEDLKISGGVANISIHGYIDKRESFLLWWMGGTATTTIMDQLKLAMASEDVESVILNIDSPGGRVDGVQDLADYLFSLRGQKPITAVVDGECCSAAYWIAAQADKIIAGETAIVGSIGVYSLHADASKFYESMGVDFTYIHAGRFKVLGNDKEPLSKEAKSYLQGFPDTLYSVFTESVARGRGVPVETVRKDMAEGKLFMGDAALEAGLIDGIGTFSTDISGGKVKYKLVSEGGVTMTASAGNNKETSKDDSLRGESPMGAEPKTQEEEVTMETLKELQAKHPDLVKEATNAALVDFKASDEFTQMKADSAALPDAIKKAADAEATSVRISEALSASVVTGEKAVADAIVKKSLAESTIPEGLREKAVKSMPDYSAHKQEGQLFEAGSTGAIAFEAVVKAEVDSWEKSCTSSAAGGASTELKGDGMTDAEKNAETIRIGIECASMIGETKSGRATANKAS